jgi:glycosyltransferase involved in cell wall biosynthesis
VVKHERPDIEVVTFGVDDELGSAGFAYTNLGIVLPDDLAAAMNESHVLLSLSPSAIASATLEGMACGCGVVAADVPAARAAMRDGDNCLIASPEPEDVTRALLRVVDDVSLRRRLGAEAAREMTGRTWDRTGEMFEAICRDTAFLRIEHAYRARPSAQRVAA